MNYGSSNIIGCKSSDRKGLGRILMLFIYLKVRGFIENKKNFAFGWEESQEGGHMAPWSRTFHTISREGELIQLSRWPPITQVAPRVYNDQMELRLSKLVIQHREFKGKLILKENWLFCILHSLNLSVLNTGRGCIPFCLRNSFLGQSLNFTIYFNSYQCSRLPDYFMPFLLLAAYS